MSREKVETETILERRWFQVCSGYPKNLKKKGELKRIK
jgi:hypothetical protein